MPFLNADTELSPEMSQLLDSYDKMPSPRIFKSHLPFYLLHPELLNTSKVHFTFNLLHSSKNSNILLDFVPFCVNRWFMSPETLKTSSSLIITTTNYLNFTTIKEI